MILVFVLFAAYGWALVLLARKGRLSSAFIIGASVALCLWVLLVTPILAKDLFNYASYGKMITFHGVSPYVHIPAEFHGDPVLPYISWKYAISVYGPFFNYLAALTTLVARQSAIANILAFKLVAFAFFVGSLFVVDSLARRLFPAKRAFILAAVALNPFLIIQLVGGAHNDTMMLFFVLLCFLLYRHEKPVLALFSVMLAVLVKTTAAFVLLPMLVLFIRQNSRWTLRKYAQGAAVLAATPLVFYRPIWPGVSTLKKIITVGTEFSAASVPRQFRNVLQSLLRDLGLRSSSAFSIGQTATRGLFMLAFLVILGVLCYKVRDIYSLMLCSGVIIFAFVVCTSWLMPWYVGFAAVMMIVSGSYTMAAGGIGLTLVMSLYVAGLNRWPVQVFPALIALLALALVLAALWRRRRAPSLEAAEA